MAFNRVILTDEYAYFNRQLASYYTRINPQILWQQPENNMFGKKVKQPRLSANYSEDGSLTYVHSGKKHSSLPYPSQIMELRHSIRDLLYRYKIPVGKMDFAVANKYRDGNDYIGWHSDDEGGIDQFYPIVRCSFGASRMFQWRLKGKDDEGKKHKTNVMHLGDGDVMVMMGGFQTKYEHCIPKEKDEMHERINITFRTMKPQ